MKTKATVDIRVDPYDLKSISVWNGMGWLSVDAVAAIPADLSIWEWTAANRDLRGVHRDGREVGTRAGGVAGEAQAVHRIEHRRRWRLRLLAFSSAAFWRG